MTDWYKGWGKQGVVVPDADDFIAKMLYQTAKSEARISAMTAEDHKKICDGNALVQHIKRTAKHG